MVALATIENAERCRVEGAGQQVHAWTVARLVERGVPVADRLADCCSAPVADPRRSVGGNEPRP